MTCGSLSMVLGSPTADRPASASRAASARVPSPPLVSSPIFIRGVSWGIRVKVAGMSR